MLASISSASLIAGRQESGIQPKKQLLDGETGAPQLGADVVAAKAQCSYLAAYRTELLAAARRDRSIGWSPTSSSTSSASAALASVETRRFPPGRSSSATC